MLEALGARQIEMTADRVVMELDIGPAVYQPMGILHGGASCALAESAGSMGAFMNCDPESEFAVGIELNISHLKSKRDGVLRATAVPIRKGRSVHVWGIDLTDEGDDLVATARLTVLIRKWDSQKGA
jgi:uncharacterized protein (TIGR00369 family)